MKVFIVGAGGQARIVYEILSFDRNMEVVGFTDDTKRRPNEKIFEKPVLGPHSMWGKLKRQGIRAAIVAIGDNKIRAQRFEELDKLGIDLINAVHPRATISRSAVIGKGIVVCIEAIVNTLTKIGDNSIINTASIVDHECIIGRNVHIAPGVTLAGSVTVKDNSFIGLRSVVISHVTIGKNVVVGAGSVVLEDIPDNTMVAGIPAKIKKKIIP